MRCIGIRILQKYPFNTKHVEENLGKNLIGAMVYAVLQRWRVLNYMKFFNFRAKNADESLKNILGLFLFRGLLVGGFFLGIRISQELLLLPGVSLYTFLPAPIEIFFPSLLFSWIVFLQSVHVLPFFVISLTFGELYYLRTLFSFMPGIKMFSWILAGFEIFLGTMSFYTLSSFEVGLLGIAFVAASCGLFWIIVATRFYKFYA